MCVRTTYAHMYACMMYIYVLSYLMNINVLLKSNRKTQNQAQLKSKYTYRHPFLFRMCPYFKIIVNISVNTYYARQEILFVIDNK